MALRRYRRRRGRRHSKYGKVRRRIGHPVGKTTTKEYIVGVARDTLIIKSLHSQCITDIPPTSALDVNERNRQAVNLRGWRFYMEMQNVAVATDSDVIFNWAIIAPRNPTAGGTSNMDEGEETNDSVMLEDFFRDGTQDTRSLNFNIPTGGSPKWWNSLVYNKYPINPDKYHILRHKKFFLADTENANGPTTRSVRMYVPLKRQIRYYNQSNGVAYDRVFMVAWADVVGSSETTVTPTATVCQFNYYVHAVFREPIA